MKKLLRIFIFSKYFIVLIALVVGIASSYFWYPNNWVEEVAEEIIKEEIGININLTPNNNEQEMKASQKGIDLIKQFEGFKDYVYTCPAEKPTIGYGHVIPSIDIALIEMLNSSPHLSQDKAEEFLKNDIKAVESAINSLVRVSYTKSI